MYCKTLQLYQKNQKNTIPQESWSWGSEPGAFPPRLRRNLSFCFFWYSCNVLHYMDWFYWFYWYSCSLLQYVIRFSRSGMLWATLGCSGRPWEALGGSVKLWGALGSSGWLWDAVGSSGEVWDAVGWSGRPWEDLGGSGKLWESLGYLLKA